MSVLSFLLEPLSRKYFIYKWIYTTDDTLKIQSYSKVFCVVVDWK